MCQEHHCDCCPDNLPEMSCDCEECFHDNKPDEGHTHQEVPRMNSSAGIPQDQVKNESCAQPCCTSSGVECKSNQSEHPKWKEGGSDEAEGNRCTKVGPRGGNACCVTPQQVSTCCPGRSCKAGPDVGSSPDVNDCHAMKPSACNSKPDVHLTENDESSASNPKPLSCCSGKTFQEHKENISTPAGDNCCAAKSNVSDCCSLNACGMKADLPTLMKSNCCVPDAKTLSHCSGDPCEPKEKISTPEVDNCCAAKSTISDVCGMKAELPPPKNSDCCVTNAKTTCCSGELRSPKEKISTPEVDSCCAAKSNISGCCSENACNIKTELPPPRKSDCLLHNPKEMSIPEVEDACTSKPNVSTCCSMNTSCGPKQDLETFQDACSGLTEHQSSTCCPGDLCSSETEILTPEVNGCCTGKPKAPSCCSEATSKPKPSCEEDDSCSADAEVVSREDEPLLSKAPRETLVAIQIGDEAASVVKEQMSDCLASPNVEGTRQLGVFATTKLRVQNICCAMEGKLVEDSLKPLDGVSSVAVNVIGRVVYVRHDPELTSAVDLANILNGVHLGASIMESGSQDDRAEDTGLPRSLKLFSVYLIFQTVLMVIAVNGFFLKSSWYKWVAIAEIVIGIVPILRKSYVSVKTCTLDINILMLIAIAGTVAIQEWVEGATVVFVYSVAEGLEEFCMHKVQRTISGLMLKAPQMAVLADSGECVHVEKVPIGTVLAVRPGELIPLDGVVVKGRAAVDESSISGEAVPVEKSIDSKVCSGTVNQNGYLEVKTTVDSSTSTVSKVAAMVEEAQASSTQTEIVINSFAKYYTPLIVLVAVLLVVIPAILGASGMVSYLQDISEWGERALFLLVIACPCALVMATPIAVVCGITAASRNGALVKGAVHLETLARLQTLAFDKTGTLTEGKFEVTDIECAVGVNERETLRLAAAIESKTSHPLAAGIVNKFSGCVAEMLQSQSDSLPPVSSFQMHEGRGISGVVEGKCVQIGNHEFLHHVGGTLLKDMEEKYLSWSRESKTVVFVCVDRRLAMMLSLTDSIRSNSMAALQLLRELGIQTAMITGDNSQTAMAVRNKLGLDECVSQMKPHEKLSWIKNKQEIGQMPCNEIHPHRRSAGLRCRPCSQDRPQGIVGMVGDGVNDGPALAAANVGIAMGAGGTALAVEAADVALMSNNLTKIPELVLLSRFCQRIVRQNIVFSVLLKLLVVVVALAGKAALWMAVLADVLGLLCVILNGLRPLWWKAKMTKMKVEQVDLGKTGRMYHTYETCV